MSITTFTDPHSFAYLEKVTPFKAWIPRDGFAIGTSAKCGSQSLLAFFDVSKLDRVRFEEMPKNLLKIGIIRDPVARFWSLYGNIQERKRSSKNFYAELEGKEAKEVLRALEKNWMKDIHFHPQMLIGLDRCDYVIRLEECFWLPTRNSSERRWEDKENIGVRNRVRSLYRPDWLLWEASEGKMEALLKDHPELFSRGS